MAGFDLGALAIFRQVAHDGSIAKATRSLHRVPSSISVRIKQLEERLGTSLFHRRRRGLELTEDGRILLGYAERLLDLSDEAAEALADGRPRGTFRIGTMESTAAARLPSVLSRYHAVHPDVEIQLATDVAANLVSGLRSHEIDAAFIAEPVTTEGLEAEPVFEESLVLVTPPSIDRERLDGETMIAFAEGCAYRRYLQDWLLEEEVSPGTVLSVGSYLAMLACVAAGTGFAVVPQSVLGVIGRAAGIGRYPLPGRYSAIRTLLVWRQGNASPKLTALKAVLRDIRPV